MPYCLNPACPSPKNPPQVKICQSCGSQLLLRNRYLVGKKIGKGGFGATFLAADLSLPGTPCCVIKQLRPSSSDPGLLEMARELFEREARTLGKIGSHPQVPRLLDYFEDHEQFYLIQEFVQGLNLQQEVKQIGLFNEEKIRNFIREILPLLDYIHSQKVIHRDIKPANIIRRDLDQKLVLIDFGAVKNDINTIASSNPAGQTALTAFAIGTLGFAPPEQLAMRPVYASDIYAVGVTAIYLLTGKSPRDLGIDPTTGELQWQESVNISRHLTNILQKMLELSVRHRYQNGQDILNVLDLDQYVDDLSQGMTSQSFARHKLGSPLPSSRILHTNSRPPASPRVVAEAEAIRAYQDRRRQKAVDVGGIWSNDQDETQDLTSLQKKKTEPSTKLPPKLPPKLTPEMMVDFYNKGWRDFGQRNFNRMNLRKADLAGSNFHQSQLSETNFQNANLANSDFGRANLLKAILRDADLTSAYLGYANLEGADLRGANLTSAYLNYANLQGANLCGANLSGATVTDSQLGVAKINWKTILPSGRRPIL